MGITTVAAVIPAANADRRKSLLDPCSLLSFSIRCSLATPRSIATEHHPLTQYRVHSGGHWQCIGNKRSGEKQITKFREVSIARELGYERVARIPWKSV